METTRTLHTNQLFKYLFLGAFWGKFTNKLKNQASLLQQTQRAETGVQKACSCPPKTPADFPICDINSSGQKAEFIYSPNI